jgi:hypothetical protein
MIVPMPGTPHDYSIKMTVGVNSGSLLRMRWRNLFRIVLIVVQRVLRRNVPRYVCGI